MRSSNTVRPLTPVAPGEVVPSIPPSRRPERLAPLVFPLLALLLLWDVLAGGRVLLPAEYLKGMAPWNAGLPAEAREALPQWNVLQWDGLAEFYPWRLHAARAVQAGQIPLWNPHVLSGTPFLANSQSAPLYPPHLLLYLPFPLDLATRMGWLAFLHLSLAGAFAYLLARDSGARWQAALVGGAAFELSGFAVAWLELPSFISVTCWIPLLLLCLGRAVRLDCLRWAAAAGVAGGLMLLAGHLQIAFYGLLAAGIVWAWEAGTRLRGKFTGRALGRAILAGAITLGTMLALAAPQLLPAVELSRMSHRVAPPTAEGYRGYLELAMPLQNWITLLVPDYYGLPVRGDFWGLWKYGPPNVMEYAGHVGAPAFLLVLLALGRRRGAGRRAWLWGCLALVALLVAVGSPLARPLYFFVPGFSQSGSPARVLVLFCLAQAMLAALGAEGLLRRAEDRWTSVPSALALGAGGAVAAMVGMHLLGQGALPPALPDTAALTAAISLPALVRACALALVTALVGSLLVWLHREGAPGQRAGALAGGLLLLTAGGLLLTGGSYNLTAAPEAVYPSTPLTRGLQSVEGRVITMNRRWDLLRIPPALLPPNASLAYGWRDSQGYDSLYLGHYRRFANALHPGGDASPPENGNIVFIKEFASPLLPLLAARYVVSQQPLQGAGLRTADGFPAGPPHVYEYRPALPEAYTVTRWEAAEDAIVLERLAAAGMDRIGTLAFVPPGSGGAGGAVEAPVPAGARAASVRRDGPGRLTVRGDSPAPGFLVLVEGYAPGWNATVRPAGGAARRERVVRANVAFQGVPVPAGPVEVEWRYEPATFRAGLFCALAAVCGLLGAAFAARPTRTR